MIYVFIVDSDCGKVSVSGNSNALRFINILRISILFNMC